MVEEKCKRLDHFSQSLEDVIKIKVVVIGDVSVGKTSLATRFTKDLFEEKITHTIGGLYILNLFLDWFDCHLFVSFQIRLK